MRARDLLLVAAVLASTLASSVLIVVALHERKVTLDKSSHEICVAIQNINTVVTSQLERSKRNLSKLSYFQEHPNEMREQIAAIDRQLVDFRPRHCH